MDQPAAHQRAQEAFAAVLSHVGPDQLALPTPCGQWNVAQLVGHVIDGNRRISGEDPIVVDTLPAMVEAHAASAAAAQVVLAAPGALTQPFPTPFGELPGSVMVNLRTADALTHAWDLAHATGQPEDVDPEVAQAMLAFSQARLTPALRGPGLPFGDERPCDPAAPAATRLAAFLGRDTA